MLVKYWSNTGQTLVKYWSNSALGCQAQLRAPPVPDEDSGRKLVKYWSNTPLDLQVRAQLRVLQFPLVEYWSNPGQILVKYQLTAVRPPRVGRPSPTQQSMDHCLTTL
jgi:hypothetical protein